MRLLAGTSGFSYREWKGSFYPPKIPAAEMLGYYAARFPTVEINNTFYRLPKPVLMTQWASEVPDEFVFVLKASRRITHFARLAGADEQLGYLCETARALGGHLGPLLFQLPPNMPRDLGRLDAFTAQLPGDLRAVFEFRHPSWFDEEVYALLRARGAALCASDRDDVEADRGPNRASGASAGPKEVPNDREADRGPNRASGASAGPKEVPNDREAETPLVATADFGYLRLRRAAYERAELAAWAERVRAQPWQRAYVFFKHEDAGTAPQLAAALTELWG